MLDIGVDVRIRPAEVRNRLQACEHRNENYSSIKRGNSRLG
jgi:hypothetical protein